MNFKKTCLVLAGALIVALPAMAEGQTKINFRAGKKHPAPSATVKAASVAPEKTVYAWASRNRDGLANGIVSFSLSKPDALTSLYPLSNYAYAGCYGNGKYFFDRYRTYTDTDGSSTWAHIALSTVDLATGAVTDINDWKDEYFVINDMTYDYTKGLIYAMCRTFYIDDFLTGFNFQYSGLYTINPTTGVMTEVKQFIDWGSVALGNATYYTLACDLNGRLWSVNQNGQLVYFDADNDYAEVVVGATGMHPAQTTQSMEFDHSSGTLYWCYDPSSSVSELLVVDTATGHCSSVGPTGSDSHLVGLYIPFDVPADAAPAAVSAYTITPDPAGGLSAQLSWTNPVKSFGGYNLATISRVFIERNGEIIATLTGATPGATMEYTDNVTTPGLYTYTVIPANSVGNGCASGITRWVGLDVPSAVTNLGIGRLDDDNAYLEWEAPTSGLHGGIIDNSTLGYKITRMPDGTVVASDCRETSFTDTNVPGTGRYSYIVESHTATGVGDVAKSVEIALGNGIDSFPWSTMFADQSEFNLWTVVNVNGGSSWKWKQRSVPSDGYETQAMYEFDNANDGDDYLISPDLYLRKGARYTVKFAYAGANAYHTENLELTFGQGKTEEAQNTVLNQYEMKDGTFRTDEVELPQVAEDGYYNFAFHATSKKGSFNIYITDVTVKNTVAAPDDPDVPELTAPYNLKSEVDNAKGEVTLSWNNSSVVPEPAGENITEDCESMEKWEINPAGEHGFTYLDRDGGIPYVDDNYEMPYPTDGVPCAAMCMNPYELYEDIYTCNPAHSGQQYLLFKSNFYDANRQRPAPAPDNWLFSPELNFGQDFIFRFYCKADPDKYATSDPWNSENFEVGYSTTDNNPESFTFFTDKPETVRTSADEWVKKEYSIPADAKYVCIHHCTPSSGYWFMVDDIFIGVETPAAKTKAAAGTATFKAYEVFVDDKMVLSTTETSCKLSGIADGHHVARVEAVYNEGRSQGAITTFVLATGAVSEISGDALKAWYSQADNAVLFSASVSHASLHSLAGATVAAADNTDRLNLSAVTPGLYILEYETPAGHAVLKLTIH